jgi:hypothetical protein
MSKAKSNVEGDPTARRMTMQTFSLPSQLAVNIAPGVATVAAALLLGGAIWISPQPAHALPKYAAETGLPCGRCHVNPAGGGPRTAFGKAFAANGHKLPKKK